MTVVASGELELKLSQSSLTAIEKSLQTSFNKARNINAGLDPKASRSIEGALTDAAKKAGAPAANQFAKAFSGDLGRLAGVVGGGLVAALGAATFAATGFDKAMSGVRAVADATGGEMGQLREAALAAGKATVFSASQAAQAEAELAKAGIDVADILSGGLRGALDLAAAGQIDLAEAATIAAQALNIFKLEGRETSHVADVLAAAANKSAADVSQLGQALRQGGLGASQAGLSLEETAGALALFADNALIGSDAGTSLKTFLARLVPSSNEAAGAMKDLGIEFFDANGNMKSLAAISDVLKEKLGGLTQQQRSLALTTIFGSDATRAATILYGAGAQGVREYTAAVNDQGAAGRNAAIQLDNLAGDLEQLKGSIETALIGAGSGGTTALRGLAQAANDAVGGFIELPSIIQFGATALAGLVGVSLSAAAAFGFLQPKIAATRLQLEGLGPAGAKAAAGLNAASKLTAFAGAATTLAFAIEFLDDRISEAISGKASVSKLTTALIELGDSGKVTGELAKQLGKDLGDLNKKTTGKITFSRDLKKDIKAVDESLAELAGKDLPLAKKAFTELADAAEKNGLPLDQLRRLLPKYGDALTANTNQLKLNAAEKRKAKAAAEELAAAELKANDAAETAFKRTAASLEARAKSLTVNLKGITAGLAESIFGGLIEGMDVEQVKEFSKQFEELGKAIGQSLDVGDLWAKLEADGTASIKSLNKALESQIKALSEWQENLRTVALRGGEEFALELQKMGPNAAGLIDKIAEATAPEFEKLKANFTTAGHLSGTAYAAQLQTELQIVAALAAGGGQKTAVEIAAGVIKGLGKVEPELIALVNALAAQLGIKIPITLDTAAANRQADLLIRKFAEIRGAGPVSAAEVGREERRLGVDLNGNGIIGRQSGGPFAANQTVLVGERGPELVRFRNGGTVVNNTETERVLAASTSIEQNITINEVTADPRVTAFTVATSLGQASTR